MKTKLEQIKDIEANINYFLDTYDSALLEGNDEMAHKAVDCIEYEIEKLRQFGHLECDIEIKTETYVQ